MDDLIGRWIAGDAEAGEKLYRVYFERLKEFVVARGDSLTDAEDVAQEAIIAGLEGLKAGKAPDRLTGWLLGIAKHKAARKFHQRFPGMDEDEEFEDPRRSARSVVIRKEMSELLEKTVGRLSPEDRKILDLLHRAGLSRKEIAEKLDLTLVAVQARCERAHSRLRRALTRHFSTVALPRLSREPLPYARILELRPAFRQAIIVYHLEELPTSAAALRLAIPESTLRARLRSAYEILRCDATADFSLARSQYHEECRQKGMGGGEEMGR